MGSWQFILPLKDRPKWTDEFKEIKKYGILLCSKKYKCNAYNK